MPYSNESTLKKHSDYDNHMRWSELYQFLSGLDAAQARQFLIHDLTTEGNIVIEPPDKLHINSGKLPRGLTAELRAPDSVTLAKYSFQAIVEPEKPFDGSGEIVKGVISESTFAPNYWAAGLWMVLGWSRNHLSGERHFMDRRQAFDAARNMGLLLPENADPSLGPVVAAGYSPEIVKSWPSKMELKCGEYRQNMGAAQAGVRPAIHHHANGLFSERNGLFQFLEAKIADRIDKQP